MSKPKQPRGIRNLDSTEIKDKKLTEEQWAVIPDFPDYEVSTYGQVRSMRCRYDRRAEVAQSPKLMTGYTDRHGYVSVILRKPGSPKPYRRTVHRLVAETFIPNPERFSDVAHIDGVIAGHGISNLRWSTHRDNSMDMRRHGTMQDGEKSCTAKLTAGDVEIIRKTWREHRRGSQTRISQQYGISKAQVCRIINGTRWASTHGVNHG